MAAALGVPSRLLQHPDAGRFASEANWLTARVTLCAAFPNGFALADAVPLSKLDHVTIGVGATNAMPLAACASYRN
jgi:hypothetical protein